MAVSTEEGQSEEPKENDKSEEHKEKNKDDRIP